jgi:HK97 family phage portal protein
VTETAWEDVAANALGLSAVQYGAPDTLRNEDGWFVRAIGGGKTNAGPQVSEFIAKNLTSVYACLNRISNPVARFPISIRRPKPDGGSEEVVDHPFSSALKLRPNTFMSSRTMRKTVQCHALLWGNGYCEIERNGAGQAVGLWPLLPWLTRPVYEDNYLFYRTSVAGQQYRLDQDDVVHIMDQSQDGYCGESPIYRARQALGLAFATEEFGAKFFGNDAKSGGFLMHPDRLSPQARENISASLEARSGLDNAHRIKLLEENIKFVQTTIPPEDAQFLGTRLFQLAEIARIYDVPLILLQSHDGVPSWGTGIEQLMIGFVRQTLEPWVAAWEQELNWKLFTEEERAEGLYVKFNMNALLRGDMAARGTFYSQLFAVGGLSPNMILEHEDEEGIGSEGDHHFVPVNMQTIEKAVQAPAPQPAAAPAQQVAA